MVFLTTPSALAQDPRGWAEARQGDVTWAAIEDGRLRHHRGTRLFPSASVTKALLMAAVLRRHADRPLPAARRVQLDRLIRHSGNRAGSAVHRELGDAAILEVARAAGMTRLRTTGRWSEVRICAIDVARFFDRLDALVPQRHRAHARRLLSTLVPSQDWGLPAALEPRGWFVQAKGGWRAKLVHQGGLVERDGRRVALAILTDGSPTHEYGRFTVEGLARRIVGPGA